MTEAGLGPVSNDHRVVSVFNLNTQTSLGCEDMCPVGRLQLQWLLDLQSAGTFETFPRSMVLANAGTFNTILYVVVTLPPP